MEMNVGMVGYKFMGKAHSNAFKKVSMFFDPSFTIHMQALCGRNESAVREAAEKFGWKDYETSWERVIDREDINVIDIGAPSDVHKEIALAAAEKGKHIFCEKPLALNLKDAREMLSAAEKNKVKHMVGFSYRFMPSVQLAKKLILSGKLGKIYHFRALYLQDWIVSPEFPLVWRLDKKIAGSGALGDIGAHIVDLSRFLMGDIDRVTGMTKTFIKERPLMENAAGLNAKAAPDASKGEVTVDDAALFLAEFKNGALGSFEATRFGNGHKNGLSFEINGSKGSLKFEFEKMNELQFYSSEDEEGIQGFRTISVTEPIHPYAGVWWPAGHIIGYEHTFVHEFYEFFQAIETDTVPMPDFSEGVKCSQVLEAVELSVENGQWIKVDSL